MLGKGISVVLNEFGENHSGAEADGGVGVVATGVHDARAFGGAGDSGFFEDGEGVHVGTDGEDILIGAGLTVEFGDDASFADHFLDLKAVGGEDAGDVGGGFVFLSAEFGVGVNMAANFDETGLEFGGDFLNGGEHGYAVRN